MVRILSSLLLCGCLATSPEKVAEDELGSTDHCVSEPGERERECGSPYHRPGQPCLVCHSGLHSPTFAVAGTIYRRASDTTGLGGVEVAIVDALGQEVSVRTNASGNFMVREGRRGGDRDDGEVGVPFHLEFPLTVDVSYESINQEMRSLIWRDGSCAGCHSGDEGPNSPGRIYVEE